MVNKVVFILLELLQPQGVPVQNKLAMLKRCVTPRSALDQQSLGPINPDIVSGIAPKGCSLREVGR